MSGFFRFISVLGLGALGAIVFQQHILNQSITGGIGDVANAVSELRQSVSYKEELDKKLEESAAADKELSEKIADLQKTVEALSQNDTEGVDALGSALLLSRLTDSQIRSNVANILQRIGGKKAEERLLEMVKTDSDSSVVSSAFNALSSMQSREVGAIAIQRLQDRRIRDTAANVLMQIAEPDMADDIIKALVATTGRDNNNGYFRANLYQVLSRIASPKTFDAIARSLRRETESYALRQGLEALVKCASAENVPELLKTINKLQQSAEGKNISWHSIIQACGRIGDPRLSEFLVSMLDHKEEYTRRTAIETLCQIADPAVAKEVAEAYGKASGNVKSRFDEVLKQGYPGIIYDEKEKKVTLVPEEEMKKLLEKREKRIKALIADDKQNAELF